MDKFSDDMDGMVIWFDFVQVCVFYKIELYFCYYFWCFFLRFFVENFNFCFFQLRDFCYVFYEYYS